MINDRKERELRKFCCQCHETVDMKKTLLKETKKLAFVASWLRDKGKKLNGRIYDIISTNLMVIKTDAYFDCEFMRKQINKTEREVLILTALSRSRRNIGLVLEKCEKACYSTEKEAMLHDKVITGLAEIAASIWHTGVTENSRSEADEFIMFTLADLYECILSPGQLAQLAQGTENYRRNEPII